MTSETLDLSSPPQAADAELARLAQAAPAGDAFRALYERHRGEVYGFVRKLLDDDGLAEDALQEAFFRVHLHLDRYDPRRAFRPWLLGIARNAALKILRAHTKRGPIVEPSEGASSDRVAASVVAEERALDARAVLRMLPGDTRALLLERHALGLKLAELAESYGCTERTIRNRLDAAGQAFTRALVEQRKGPA